VRRRRGVARRSRRLVCAPGSRARTVEFNAAATRLQLEHEIFLKLLARTLKLVLRLLELCLEQMRRLL
jgi:hypothetical protein